MPGDYRSVPPGRKRRRALGWRAWAAAGRSILGVSRVLYKDESAGRRLTQLLDDAS